MTSITYTVEHACGHERKYTLTGAAVLDGRDFEEYKADKAEEPCYECWRKQHLEGS